MFWHTLSDEPLGKSVRIVPVYTDISYILWRPRHMGGGILARAIDGQHWTPANATFKVQLVKDGPVVEWKVTPTVAQSGLADWGSGNPADPNSQPAATQMYNMAVILPDLPRELSPVVVTMQRSAIRVARKFTGKLRIAGEPIFGQYYLMESFEDASTLGKFFNYKFTMQGFVKDEAQYSEYRATYDAFKSLGITIKDMEGIQDDETTAPDVTF